MEDFVFRLVQSNKGSYTASVEIEAENLEDAQLKILNLSQDELEDMVSDEWDLNDDMYPDGLIEVYTDDGELINNTTESQNITITLPLIENVKFDIECLSEYEGPEGHFATGDDEADEKTVAQIRKDLESNEWAWCCIKVTASWKGLEVEDYLGGCNYAGKDEFMYGGYYDSMKEVAYENLINQIKALAE